MIRLALAALLLAGPAAAAERIVVATDSHGVLAFGEALESWLRARPGAAWVFWAAGGSAPRQWTTSRWTTPCGFHADSARAAGPRGCYSEKVPHLDELWAAQPARAPGETRVTVIAHGTNLALTSRAAEVAAVAAMIAMADAASDRCVWIGPPNMTRSPGYDAAGVEYKYGVLRDGIAKAAKAAGRSCALLDSRTLSTYPREGGDGIHYQWLRTKDPVSLGRGREWGEAVSARLSSLL